MKAPIQTIYYRPGVAKPLAIVKADVDHSTGARELMIEGEMYILSGAPVLTVRGGVLTRSWPCAVPLARKKRFR